MNRFWTVVAFFGISVAGMAELALPEWTRPLVDEAGLLNSGDHARIEKKLIELRAVGRVQMAIYLPASLQGYVIEDFSIAAAEKWKIGNKKEDRGLLLVIASRERQMRLEVGYGLEGVIPDVIAKRILDDEVTPYLRQGRMADALEIAIDAVAERLGVSWGDSSSRSTRRKGLPDNAGAPFRTAWKLIWFLLVLVFVFRLFLRPRRWMGSRRGHWGGGSWPVGGGGLGRIGGSGGGFGGWSGGGGFGGGGASSRW